MPDVATARFARAHAPASLCGRFAGHAARAPDAEAVRNGTRSLSYAELEQRAGVLAAHIARAVAPGAFVGIHLERGVDVVVAILAAMRAGRAYVPLDPAYPEHRLAFIAADAGIEALLADREPALGRRGSTVIRVDRIAWEHERGTPPVAQAGAPVCLMYTSGSTGRPKGAIVMHDGIAALIDAFDEVVDVRATDVLSMFHSYSFDPTLLEMWQALSHGATVAVLPDSVARTPRATLRFLAEQEITILNLVPSVLRHLARAIGAEATPPELGVRWLLLGGEVLDLDVLRTWLAAAPRSRIVNIYGVTEATVATTARVLDPADLDSPESCTNVGRPLRHARLAIVGPDERTVAPGEVGEALVGGAGVTAGYHGRPELTGERFVRRTIDGEHGRWYRSGDLMRLGHDGTLSFAGRADDQLKVRGFRIEPGEVEAVLADVYGVRDVAVVSRRGRTGEDMVVAFYVAETDLEGELRDAAMAELPAHVVPSRCIRIPAIPATASGKADRLALSTMEE